MGPAVSGKTVFGFIAADRSFFTVTDRAKTGRRHSLRQQKLFDGIRTAIAQADIVFLAAALVAVSFNGQPCIRVGLQPSGVCHEYRYLVGPNVRFVVIEQYVL